jgi:hypothetical protein
MLVAQEQDAYFLTQVFRADPWQDPVAPEVMSLLAARLHDLGFQAEGDALLLPRSTPENDGRNGAARTPIAVVPSTLRQPDRAESDASTASPPAVTEPTPLGADARQGAATDGASTAAPTAAPSDAGTPGAPIRQPIAPDTLPAETGLLFAGRKALEDSAAMRARITQLLPP